MKKKFFICLIAAALLAASFFAGSYAKEKKILDSRAKRCSTLASFALEKAENEDLTDPAVMKALASNVYAAYQYCDDPKTADQLHDLWNYLLDHSSEDGAKDVAMQELKGIMNSFKASDK